MPRRARNSCNSVDDPQRLAQSLAAAAPSRPDSLLVDDAHHAWRYAAARAHSPPPPPSPPSPPPRSSRRPVRPPSPTFLIPRDLDRYPHGHGHSPERDEQAPVAHHDKPLPHLPPGGSHPSRSHLAHQHHLSDHALLLPPYRPSLERRESSFHTAHGSIDSLLHARELDDDPFGDDAQTPTAPSSAPQTMSKTLTKPVDLKLTVEGKPSAVEEPKAKSPMSFFGWKSKPREADSPTTTFSESRSVSPMPSPLEQSPPAPAPAPLKQAMHEDEGYHGRSGSLTYGESANLTRVDELMRELEHVSTELAASIRREMELEDEIERYQADMPPPSNQEAGRRTSDYYSDSGASSVRLPIGETETKLESLEKMRRKLEQEKAQMRVDMSGKVQEDLNQKKALELHIQTLEGQLRMANLSASEPSEKEKEMEGQLQALTRKRNEEKELQSNFDELLAGMRTEMESTRNERDNLRDEVVPQLKARLEGLEHESSQSQTLQYEITRLQQEVENLKNENQALNDARKMQTDFQASKPRLMGISNLGAATDAQKDKAPKENIPLDQLPAHLKDVEDQRDALHLTLKNLIIRQHQMTTDYRKQVKVLEMDRDRHKAATPRRAAFAVEVQWLRQEVNKLRRRADDALEQKWQCEKGLSGIKMDLDRAQQETASLRALVQEQEDIASDSAIGSDSLDQAYTELRQVQEMVKTAPDASSRKSAELRMEQLSHQVSSQLMTNQQLRSRLTEAIGRGEREQDAAAQKIVHLQNALKEAEERLAAAQAVSEEAIAKHEEHVRLVKEAQEDHRIRSLASPLRASGIDGKFVTALGNGTAGNSHLTVPNSKSPFSGRKPRLHKTSSGASMSMHDATKTTELEDKVRQMEEAAVRAEAEMQGVVEAMNKAQIEVVMLQTERDEAMRSTRRLQREVLAEQEKMKAMA